MISIRNMAGERHIPNRRFSKAGCRFLLFLLILSLAGCYPATYQQVTTSPPPPSRPVTQVYFYPLKGQTTEQQSRDHYECYNWAVQQTGYDPSVSSIPPTDRVRVVPMPPPGHDTAVLAIAGAVLGALIGGPRHAAAGALIGAGGGAVAGAVSDEGRRQQAAQIQEAYNNRDQALDARHEAEARNFRRAMSACLEGRGYTVK